MTGGWPKTTLSTLLRQVSRPEDLDPSRDYTMLGARWYAGGLFKKEVQTGQSIKAARVYRVQSGDFIYNRLFAWKGSFAVADRSAEGCYMSNEFPCFEVDSLRLDARYLLYYFVQSASWSKALGLSSGATPNSRNRLKEKQFLQMTIPLPPLSEQHRLVGWIDGISVRADEVAQLTEDVDASARALLLQAFWRIAGNAPRKPMSLVAPLIRRPIKVTADGIYAELGIRSFGKGTFHKPALSGTEIGSKRIFAIEPGDLLFSNFFAWEGAIAVAKQADSGRCGSHRFITCVPHDGVATPEFLCFYFLTREVLAIIGTASPGSRTEQNARAAGP